MEVALSHEKIWFDKYKYEDAERVYFENLAKLLNMDEKTNKSSSSNAQVTVPCAVKSVPVPVSDPEPVPNPDPVTLTPVPLEPRPEDKRFKVKNRNKSKKDGDKKVEKVIKTEPKVSSNNAILKNSLAEEVAKARQHIKSSLECVDGIAKLTTDNVPVEVINRLNSLENENASLKREVKDLSEIVRKLVDRVAVLEKSGSAPVAKPAAAASRPAPAVKHVAEDDDDGVDLFGSDSEEEDEESKKVKEQRLAEYAARKSKKPVLIAKSNIILDVKPWDDETDMKKMEVEVRKVTTDGLIWGASKLVPLAYGIHKLQISCVVEDDKVSVDWLQEQLEAIEDYVQSVDIAAFNKV